MRGPYIVMRYSKVVRKLIKKLINQFLDSLPAVCPTEEYNLCQDSQQTTDSRMLWTGTGRT